MDRLFRTARSQNGWREQPLPQGTPEAIWELVKWTPTSANTEPMRVVWCVSDEARQRLAACCSSKNAPKVLGAPAVAVIGYDLAFYDKLPELFPHVDARPWFTHSEDVIRSTAFRNSTLQGAFLIMAARALGLDAGPMSGFDEAAVEEAFFAGTSIKPNFICAIGYGEVGLVMNRLPRLHFTEANQVL
jgi:3-hydroxypropanoate dehydrogenase